MHKEQTYEEATGLDRVRVGTKQPPERSPCLQQITTRCQIRIRKAACWRRHYSAAKPR